MKVKGLFGRFQIDEFQAINMNSSPKQARPRYQKIRELGNNRAGGRVTHLATDTQTGQPVVIKQFQFAQSGADWSGFKAYEREIQVLSSLNHPGIPRYLNSFETSSGFCMVQEYKDAQRLSAERRWTPEQIKQIALSVLDILVYLQSRIPPVIHRDIKPENILVDEQLNVYLVDFGLARIGGGEGAMSSVAAGTFGFMAPEQIYNRQLTEATDLYGLGATLICLLAGIKSEAIETLIEDTGRINFKPKLSKLSPRSIEWLEKMVQPKPKDRYPSAEVAKEALVPLNFTAIPQVRISEKSLMFAPPRLGEKMTKIIKVSNPVANAVLEGRWEVAPHPNDVPVKGSAHPWIAVTPAKFKGNQVECSITVDTSKLVANAVYTRQLVLQANSEPATHTVTLEVHAGAVPAAPPKKLYAYLIGSIVLLAIISLPAIYALYLLFTIRSPQFLGKASSAIVTDGLRYAGAVAAGIVWLVMGARVGGSRRGILSIFLAIPASLAF
jgi:serine/threonine protein kinase